MDERMPDHPVVDPVVLGTVNSSPEQPEGIEAENTIFLHAAEAIPGGQRPKRSRWLCVLLFCSVGLNFCVFLATRHWSEPSDWSISAARKSVLSGQHSEQNNTTSDWAQEEAPLVSGLDRSSDSEVGASDIESRGHSEEGKAERPPRGFWASLGPSSTTVAEAYSAEGSCGYGPQRPVWGNFTGDWERLGDPNAEALHTSLLYIKVPKTSSTTIAGVMRRIAEYNGLFGAFAKNNLFNKQRGFKGPVVLADHGQRAVLSKKYDSRFKPAIYVGNVRHPIKRWISRYSYTNHAECLNAKPPDQCDRLEDFWMFYKGVAFNNNLQYQYLTPDYAKATAGFEHGFMNYKHPEITKKNGIVRNRHIDPRKGTDDEIRAMLLDEVIRSYFFLVILESMDECLVVLKHKLGLPSLKHIIYYSSKASDDKGQAKLRFEDYPASVQAFIESEEFVSGNRWDLLLHELANKSLECEIQRLGLAFAVDLERFREMMRRVNEMCTLQDNDCYKEDDDCGCNRGCHNMVASLPEFDGW